MRRAHFENDVIQKADRLTLQELSCSTTRRTTMRRASLLLATWVWTVPACVDQRHDLLPGGTPDEGGASGAPGGCQDGADCGGAGGRANDTGGGRSVSGTGGKTRPTGGAAGAETTDEGGASSSNGTGGDRGLSGTGGTTRFAGGRAGTGPSGGSGTVTDTAGAGGSGDATATGGTGGECRNNRRIVITDDSNYSLSSVPSIQTTRVKDGENLTFEWGDVTRDFMGRPVDPMQDIGAVMVTLWGMTEMELTDAVMRDSLRAKECKGALTLYPKDFETPPTEGRLLDFNSFRNEVPVEEIWARFDMSTPDYQYPPATHTFMMTVSSGTDPTRETRMIGLFKLDPTSSNTTVALTNTSTTMEYSVSLADIPPIAVPAATPSLTVDWSRMTVNALGNPFDETQITEAVVAHYADYTPRDLEERFVFLREEASAWYSGEVFTGTSIDLSTLTDADGVRFPGIDRTGVWVVALFCSEYNCNNPAPWSITLLRPCE
jgi:hypothetical protein